MKKRIVKYGLITLVVISALPFILYFIFKNFGKPVEKKVELVLINEIVQQTNFVEKSDSLLFCSKSTLYINKYELDWVFPGYINIVDYLYFRSQIKYEGQQWDCSLIKGVYCANENRIKEAFGKRNLYMYSKPIFNFSRSKALILCSAYKDSLGGGVSLLLYVKNGSKWVLEKEFELTQS